MRGKLEKHRQGDFTAERAEDSLWREATTDGKERGKAERGQRIHPVLKRVWRAWSRGLIREQLQRERY